LRLLQLLRNGQGPCAGTQPELVYVDDKTGEVALRWDAPGADQHRFYEWLATKQKRGRKRVDCEHGPLGQLVSHHLGNLALIGFLRELFEETPEQFPILLTKVVYDGTHCGDHLDLEAIERLAIEMASVSNLHCAEPQSEGPLREFETQMSDLTRAARTARKPIVF
jgi:hypothetical protein